MKEGGGNGVGDGGGGVESGDGGDGDEMTLFIYCLVASHHYSVDTSFYLRRLLPSSFFSPPYLR